MAGNETMETRTLLDDGLGAIIIPRVATIRRPLTSHDYFSTPSFLTTMNFHPSIGLAAIVCMSAVSCYPYPNDSRYRDSRKGAATTATPEEMKKKTQEEMRKNKADDEMKKKQEQEQEQAASDPRREDPGSVTPPPDPIKPAEPKSDFPFANKVPGKDGFVFSPYNNKVVDVRDIPSGTLVQDPTYPASEKKYFRVP
jgi:hypothetical protein